MNLDDSVMSTPLQSSSDWLKVDRLLEEVSTKRPETWNWQTISTSILAILLCRCIVVWSYNLWFHPLAGFPGPILGRCSLFYRFIHSSRGRIHCAVIDAHNKYGDIVRIAPNELSFASAESWKAIYGHPTGGRQIARKGPFYEVLAASFRSKCIGSERDPQKHAIMRKMLNPAFSQRGLLEQEEIISGIIDKFVNSLGSKGGPGTKGLNMTKCYAMNSFEILGEMAFGESFRSLDADILHTWVEIALEHLYVITLIDNLRRIGWLSKLAGLLIPAGIVTKNQHANFTRQQVEKRLAVREARNDFVSPLVDKVRAGEVSKEEMTAHVSTIAIAGGETVATTLSSLTWFLGQNPKPLEILTKEIRAAFRSYEEIDGIKAQQLPYLQAVINEGLRMFPPASGGATRLSPGFELHGKYIPEGTDISVSPWSTCHNPKYFADPWQFKPERWLDPTSSDNKDASRPFLLGPRDCLGRNFAWMELNLMLAKLLWSYDMELVNKEIDYIEKSKVHVLWWKPELYVRWHRRQSIAY